MNEADTLYKLFFAIMIVAATQGAPTPSAQPVPQAQTPTPAQPSQPSPAAQSIFGVEFFTGFNALADQAQQLQVSWVRLNRFFWPDVEPARGERRWSAMAGLESDLIAASQRGMKVVLVVRKTPAWAQSVAGEDCSPPRREHLQAYAAFMRDAVARYSQPPYNVKYWEMGNEVDLDPSDEGNYGVWGCWGNKNDAYFGGGAYADMLKVVQPAMKSADPSAQVLLGGLLLECNAHYLTCLSNKFLEGIVRNGGGPFFDGIGFHAYDYYAHTLGTFGNPKWDSAWDTNGLALDAKLRFLQVVLQKYGVAGKYFILSETSVLCWSCPPAPPDHEATKAYFVPQLFATGMANNLKAVIWYSYNSQWEQSPLVDKDSKPLPAFTAIQVVGQKLGAATYAGVVPANEMQTDKARGYKFRVNGKEIWLMWATTLNNTLVTLPANPSAITDALGMAQPAARAFALTPKPLYIEW